MSAIDWLSQSVNESPVAAQPKTNVAESVVSGNIAVTTLGGIRKDSVGLLPPAVSGLPRDFWAGSSTETITRLIGALKTDSLPELLTLGERILLAELDAPDGAGNGATLLIARIDKLLDLGALEQAQALLERAGPDNAALFRRWFDVSLLSGHAEHACSAMQAAPGFAPTLEARIFCLARSGDWNAAALSLATGETLGFIAPADADLIARFLDPDLYEGEPDLPPPVPLTPLKFAMREAIAQPRPPGALPLAFAAVDLRRSAAWRSQLEAGERLVRSQAIDARILIEAYTARKPAASGGIWNRAAAIQALDLALLSSDGAAVARALPGAYAAMREVALEVPFAKYFDERLAALALPQTASGTALRVALLASNYETAPKRFDPATQTAANRFLLGLARGNVHGLAPPGTLGEAIAAAFLRPMPEGELFDFLTQKRLGEAVLKAILMLKDEAFADPGDVQMALSTLRAVGLEEVARRTAIQLLLLERRG